MQIRITKIRYNNAGQLDHNVGQFKIGINLKLVYNINKKSFFSCKMPYGLAFMKKKYCLNIL